MDVGMMMIFAAYGWENIGDDQVWDEELRLARLAADLGSTRCGRPSTTSSTTRSAPTICSS